MNIIYILLALTIILWVVMKLAVYGRCPKCGGKEDVVDVGYQGHQKCLKCKCGW